MITARTQVAAVIGDPIAHSRSPIIHNAAFAARSLDWTCVALRVPEGAAVTAVEGARALGLRGLSVTMPHKAAVVGAMDVLSPAAAALGSVNCIVFGERGLEGHNTDGQGFLDGLDRDFGFDPAGARCVVLGAGGAARAVVHALAGAGASRVTVVNRSADRALRAAALAGELGVAGSGDDIAGADLVVNATPVGMAGAGPAEDAMPLDPSLLERDQIVAELIYHPATTSLMDAAVLRGCPTSNGVSMLVHQAAVAFQLWTGTEAPIEAMVSAAAEAPLTE